MPDFTTTTNFALKKPTVGQAVDTWGTYLNANFDEIDQQLQTLTVSITTPDLEDLGNVLADPPTANQYLQFNGTNWTGVTVTIPTSVDDLTDVDISTTAPTANQVLTWNGSKFVPASPSDATIADGTITTAKLDTGLQTQINRILVTDDDESPTDKQILQYNTTDSEWKYADLPGSTIVTLGDVNSAGLADNALLVYNSSAGEFQFESGSTLRTTLGVDAAGTDNSTDISISTSTSYDYIVLSAGQVLTLNQVDLQTDVANTLPVTSGGTGSTTVSGARTALGVSIGSDVQAWDQQLDDISALAVTDGNIIVGNGTTWVAESGATARASLGLTIGSDVEAYSSTNADYADTTANFTGTLQNGGSNVVVDSDIGSSVQGYDADTAKYNDTTANFTGTLQNGGSNVVVDSDIGSSVQAYDADLSTIAGLSSADGNFIVGSATGWVVESGATVRTSLGLAIGTDVQAYDADTAKYDDITANFTGTLQNGGSDVLVTTDIGSSVQAAGSYLTSVNLASDVGSTVLPVANGGTGLTAIGTAGQVLKVNSGATALEFADESGGGGSSSYIEHSSTVSDSLAISSGTNRMYIGGTTFSGSGTMAGTLVVAGGYANFTSASVLNITGTLNLI